MRNALLAAGIVLCMGVPSALAAPPLLLSEYRPHDSDEQVFSLLDFRDASIVYLHEQAGVTSQERAERISYERIGCDPFNMFKDGVIVEKGFNCRTFVCVGYLKGPKVCRDRNGRSYGGVVEIQRRQRVLEREEEVPLKDFAPADRTPQMSSLLSQMEAVKCMPYFLMHYGVAIGHGYTCEEIGQFPAFSGANSCTDDWRDAAPIACQREERADEIDIRRKLLGIEAASSASSSSQAGGGASSAAPRVRFIDVIEGNYGYTAITSLAADGVLGGYSDGTFRPTVNVNRAEFTKMLLAGLFPERVDQAADRCFRDVVARLWYTPFVCTAKKLGWIAGYEDGTFKPVQTIRKAEAIKIVMTSMGVHLDSVAALPAGVDESQWYARYMRKAVELRVILESAIDPGAEATRADAAVWMYRARKYLQQQG